MNEPNTKAESIEIRDFSVSDIPEILNYWFRSPEGFIERIGVDPSKLPKEEEMKRSLLEKCEANSALPSSKMNAVVILYNGEPIGFHTLSPYTEGDSGIFHAHIWDQSLRGKGIAQHSYIKAARVFMERFELKKLVYKTPVQNTGAIRVKERLGIRCLGEETIGFGVIKDGTLAKVFEMTNSELAKFGGPHA